ncbi:MAG: GGDEF-domain containing protein, partial [Actinobacteria bacterium]|nr:GGDEF-domain containing protein [Actinomycetota bacterium]
MQRAWRPFLLVGLAAVGGYLLLPSPAAQNVVYDVYALVCVVAILAGVRIHRPERRLFWLLLAAGQGLFLAGDVVWGIYDQI